MLILKEGVSLELLGMVTGWDSTYTDYYRVTTPDEMFYLKVLDEYHFGVTAFDIALDLVPQVFDNGDIEPTEEEEQKDHE